jgi:hypothetical protein
MTVQMESVREASSSEWDEIWQKCSYATYFHSREWAEIWDAHTEGRIHPRPLLITCSDARTALLPLCSRNVMKGMIRVYCLHGGVATRQRLVLELFARLRIRSLVKTLRARVLSVGAKFLGVHYP